MRRPWSPTEDKHLKQRAGLDSISTMAEHLGRSRDAVHGRMKKLGLSGIRRGQEHWNAKLTDSLSGMIQTLSDAGYRPIEIHTLLTTPVEITRHTVEDVCAGRTWLGDPNF